MKSEGRLAFIDALKAVASQLIVLHHLAFYGPMADYVTPAAPELIGWLSQYARIAVQVFLVIGGFLAAQALARDGRLENKPIAPLLWRRYLKLVVPYLAALALAIAGAAVARSLITHPSFPDAPDWPQLLAHALLLQGVLGFDGLSAGVWYVAIDFQLYALFLLTLWLARKISPQHSALAGRLLVAALITAALFLFNRDAGWDNWAIYFFGSYGLGVMSFWSVQRGRVSAWLFLIAALTVVALAIDFRSRIAVALVVALLLGVSRFSEALERWPQSALLAWLGRISYGVFLVHFPISMIVNACFERFAPHTAPIQFIGMLVAWGASVAGGAAFYRQVECRAQRLLSKKPASLPAAGPLR